MNDKICAGCYDTKCVHDRDCEHVKSEKFAELADKNREQMEKISDIVAQILNTYKGRDQ